MDGLQKLHHRQLGYFPTKQFEGYIAQGAVLVADGLGYIIAKDRYLKRDELGVIYQLCVAPGAQRKLVGAALVKAVFERSAYGCRLYCCWCAQDIEANYFWESMGFVPIAFRGGSEKRSRVHIFWQRRIDAGERATPYWYPFQTSSGAMRADRVVFPIAPGTHWKDVQAVVVPTMAEALSQERPALAGPAARAARARAANPPARRKNVLMNGFQFASAPPPGAAKQRGNPKPKPAKAKIDPKFLAAARELRDRYLEHVNADPQALGGGRGKDDITQKVEPRSMPLLAAG